MESLRGKKRIIQDSNKSLEFQVTNWEVNDEMYESEDGNKYRFVIYAFGVTEKGHSVSVKINNFTPHFYINIKHHISKEKLDLFVSTLKNKLPFYHRDDIENYDIVRRKKYYGFDNGKEHSFIRFLFSNTRCCTKFSRLFEEEIRIPGLNKQKYDVYESNIPPLLRFLHIQNIKPSGWVKIDGKTYTKLQGIFNTQLSIETDWSNINPIEKSTIAPMVIASFDLECDSSHGDFPLPKKTFKKPCRDLFQILTKKKKDYKETIKNFLEDSFLDVPKYASKIFTKNGREPSPIKIETVSDKLAKLYTSKESYRLLATDIIINYTDRIEDICCIIEDAFCDYENNEEKTNYDIRTIYTKQNNKPSKSSIRNIANKLIIIYNKFVTKEENSNYDSFIKNHYTKICEMSLSQQNSYIEEHKLDKTILVNINLIKDQMCVKMEKRFPELDTSKEVTIKRFDSYLCELMPEIEGDKIIQIGTAVQRYGEPGCFLKHILTLDNCEPIEGCVVESFDREEDMLVRWSEFMVDLDPDIITGYNIFGFDYSYIIERAKELECYEEFSKMSRIKNKECQLVNKKLSSSALGDNTLRYIDMFGRVQMDLLKVIQRDHNLSSYKLDHVSEHFINNKVNEHNITKNTVTLKGIQTLSKGNFVTFNCGKEKYKDGQKFRIKDIDYEKRTAEFEEPIGDVTEWTLAKDDVSPNDIFRLQKGSNSDRKTIAVYCIQDCVLCIHIITKLKLITNNIAMSNVCSVPLSFIFLRGQGIKIFSLVSKECRKNKYLIPVIKYRNEEKTEYNPKFIYSSEFTDIKESESFEGAGVLKPHKGIYLEDYAVVLDFASLYPSCIISENISHDSIVLDDRYKGDKGIEELKKLGIGYKDKEYPTYKWVDPKIRSKGKIKTGTKTCRFVQYSDKKSILPSIESELLAERKKIKKLMKEEEDPVIKEIYDGEQLAIKLTCNSLYGQLGAETSPLFMLDLAASVTASGRELLYRAKDKITSHFEGSEALYGDTDSVFINFNPKDKHGNKLTGKEGLKRAIELGVEAENYFQQFLEKPHKLEYEKTFWPWIIFSKKRYIGHKYEFDTENYKETSMGIVMKRRDNAGIVKHLYGNVIKNIMINRDINLSIKQLREQTLDLINGKFPMDMLVITKTLKGTYKNPDQIAHKVLADRMGKRDPGNRPLVNDRIPYVYIENKNKSKLQGDCIEHPEFIVQERLVPDYKFYITNQIMKPVCQIYGLILETLDGFRKGEDYYNKQYMIELRKKTEDKAQIKIEKMRLDDSCDLIFGDILRELENKKKKIQKMTTFFKIKKK